MTQKKIKSKLTNSLLKKKRIKLTNKPAHKRPNPRNMSAKELFRQLDEKKAQQWIKLIDLEPEPYESILLAYAFPYQYTGGYYQVTVRAFMDCAGRFWSDEVDGANGQLLDLSLPHKETYKNRIFLSWKPNFNNSCGYEDRLKLDAYALDEAVQEAKANTFKLKHNFQSAINSKRADMHKTINNSNDTSSVYDAERAAVCVLSKSVVSPPSFDWMAIFKWAIGSAIVGTFAYVCWGMSKCL